MADLVALIKKAATEAVAASNPMGVLFGQVVSTEPLKITVEQKMTLTSKQLMLTKNVMDYETKISFNNPSIKQAYTTWNIAETNESMPSKISFRDKIEHDITIYNGLKAGDQVILLQAQGGQKYIVLDKWVST